MSLVVGSGAWRARGHSLLLERAYPPVSDPTRKGGMRRLWADPVFPYGVLLRRPDGSAQRLQVWGQT